MNFLERLHFEPLKERPAGLTPVLSVEERVGLRKMKAFRGGIESNISALKRAFGIGRDLWRDRDGYDSDVWAKIVAYNCVILSAAMR